VSSRLSWHETKKPGGAVVTFAGPAASAQRAWVGLSVIATAAVFAYLAFFAPNPKPVTQKPWFRVAPVVLALAGLSLTWVEFPGICAGTLDIDHARVRIDPVPSWRLRVEVAVAQIDYVAAESEDGESGDRGRFRVRVRTRAGARKTLATFGDAEAALFMSQRLEALLERARAARVRG
jgi:hypothetical protein